MDEKSKNHMIDHLKSILFKDDRILDENKEIDQIKLIDLIRKLDNILISLLLDDKTTREKFFIKIKDVYVFDFNKFMFFLEENKINNSYTQYENKLGLRVGDKLLRERNEVVLDFPHKDCILQGGQTKEDGEDIYFEYDEKLTESQMKAGWKEGEYNEKTSKRDEIFFNEIIAEDEIDRLKDEKALVNWKRYTSMGVEEVKELKRDANDLIKENLIIKGNNLLALHSLKKQFKGRIKLIYIDPPYYFENNKGDDAFAYNSDFKLSTWLTFMKNRLEIAKDLLREDGIIFVQIDKDGQAYLKVLMDEFKDITFDNCISVKSSTPSGVKTTHATKKILKSQDFILVYKKSNSYYSPQYIKKENWDTHYQFYIEERNHKKELINLVDILKKNSLLSEDENINNFDINNPSHKKFYIKNGDKIVRKSTHNNNEIKNICNTKYKNKIYEQNKNLYLNDDMLQPISKSIKEVLDGQSIIEDISNVLCDFWPDIDFQNTQNQGNVSLPRGKKPEQLLYRIINLSTSEGDIVLDFFLGSGTTCAVAHKMGRQYIGIEQLDYGENSAVVRLQNVIGKANSKGKLNEVIEDYDTTGISKAVNWKGGGDFVYFELAEWNGEAKKKILSCKNLNELLKLFDELYDKYFIHYNVKVKEFKEKTVNEKEFKNLSLEKQKLIFVRMLDLNQMYVLRSEMGDKKYNISKQDQKLSNMFYNEGK